MLIRSQDKKTIVNMANIDTICAKRDECAANKGIKEYYQTSIEYFNGGEETMGTIAHYSSEEKAIKVLDMIEMEYATQKIADCMLEANKKIIDSITEDELRKLVNSIKNARVFQMPQDSEV